MDFETREAQFIRDINRILEINEQTDMLHLEIDLYKNGYMHSHQKSTIFSILIEGTIKKYGKDIIQIVKNTIGYSEQQEDEDEDYDALSER